MEEILAALRAEGNDEWAQNTLKVCVSGHGMYG